MRNILSALLIVALATSALAQQLPIDQGSVTIAGQASVTRTSGDLYLRQTIVSMNPEFSYFFAKGLAAGFHFDWTYYSHQYYTGDYTNWGVGPIFAYYFNLDANRMEAKGAIYPVVKVFGLVRKYTFPGSRATWTIGGQLGLDIMMSNSVALQPSVQQRWDRVKTIYSGTVTGHIFMAGVGVEVFVY